MDSLNFNELASSIKSINSAFQVRAKQSINSILTIRNWVLGFMIQEYELGGQDRAQYGGELLKKLEKRLEKDGLESVSYRSLKLYKQFYQQYPSIGQTVSAQLRSALPLFYQARLVSIVQTLSAQLPDGSFQADQAKSGAIGRTLPGQSEVFSENPIRQTASAKSGAPSIDPEKLIKALSFSQFTELLKIDDPLKRVFYEHESIYSGWSLRELKRQIASLYYERTALSRDPKKLAEMVRANAPIQAVNDVIKDPYVFEFLGLKPSEALYESGLAHGLIDKLQEFLLELGSGFCFEARNKRILIGDEYFFVDLVLYNRILKCHVLVELKMQHFNHENIGQLNTYLNYYKKNEMLEGDNPPIGILLCTEKNHALVEYALTDNQNQLFVSRYNLELPSKEVLQEFIEKQLKENLEVVPA